VGLSDDAKIGIYSSNENNDLQLFDVSSGKKLDVLKSQDCHLQLNFLMIKVFFLLRMGIIYIIGVYNGGFKSTIIS